MAHPDRPIADESAGMPWHARLVIHTGLLELIVAGALALVALWLWVGSYSFAEGEGGLTGAVAFPRGVSLVLGGACLLLAYQAAQGLYRGDTAEPVIFRRPGAVLASAVLIVLYPLLLPQFGFYPTTCVWLLALLWVVGVRNPMWGITTTVGFLAVVKFAFQMAMGIPLP